ncbi:MULTISPECIES: ATP-dependent nuclease [Cyanophyceae]|uniref:ATP-dependent nuclease n=1 Tax=Cyanophyceae TaxID=3028117 RepID=UPI0016827CFE|nr:AAA family ATPase [Trichocoleus sp. FACHB-40]MBD2001830.1 AAA family ATPase [Trichocoleus sp. FACHB-40]
MQIKITLKNYRCFSDSKPARITLRKGFTALIGINNSGKTALLKFFYEFRSLLSPLSETRTWLDFSAGLEHTFNPPKELLDNQEIFCNTNNRPLVIELDFLREDKSEFGKTLIPKKLTITVQRNLKYVGHVFGKNKLLISHPKHSFDGQKNAFVIEGSGTILAEISSAFLDSLIFLGQTLYIGPFRNVINLFPTQDINQVRTIQSLHTSYFDINVGLSLIQRWRESKTGNNKELVKRAYTLQNDIKRIFDFESIDINSSVNDQTIQFVINGEVYSLSEIGSGLSQFFLILANVAVNQPSYILIDEPELNLHPSLQLDFLTTLGNYAEHGILFSTHSMGLARASAEQIYVVHKDKKNEGSEINEFDKTKSSKHLSEFLGELSFSAYREFGFNKVLLVEGPTEVKTIQQFLRKYGKEHEILLLPLGGSSLINGAFRDELQEIKRISDNIYALIDSELEAPDEELAIDRKEFVDTCKQIGIIYHVLKYRAIENYFPDHAVKAIKGDKFSALNPYESLKIKSQYGWSKADNWRMAKEMTLEELSKTDIGKFIEQLIA